MQFKVDFLFHRLILIFHTIVNGINFPRELIYLIMHLRAINASSILYLAPITKLVVKVILKRLYGYLVCFLSEILIELLNNQFAFLNISG